MSDDKLREAVEALVHQFNYSNSEGPRIEVGIQWHRDCARLVKVVRAALTDSGTAPESSVKREVLRFVQNEVEIDVLQLKALADLIDGGTADAPPEATEEMVDVLKRIRNYATPGYRNDDSMELALDGIYKAADDALAAPPEPTEEIVPEQASKCPLCDIRIVPKEKGITLECSYCKGTWQEPL